MKQKIVFLLLIQSLLFNSYASGANSTPLPKKEPYYNELYNRDGLRDLYQPLRDYILNPSNEKDREAFLRTSRKAFHHDNALDPIPRILTEAESLEIQRGVDQRARALRAFLKDHYSGQRDYSKAGIMPDKVAQRIIVRTGESSYEGLVNPETISFMYGPDIIRDAQGHWRVIEDNPGFIGGIGDLKLAYDLMLKKHQALQENFEFADPMNFYKSITKAFREKGQAYGGKTILYMTPPYADYEDERIKQIFAREGVETITPKSNKRLQITSDGVFLAPRGSGPTVKEKVGYIFMNGEHAWLDNTHPAARIRNILEAANEYLKDKRAKPQIAQQISDYLAQVDPITGLPNLNELEKILKNTQTLDSEKSYAAGLLNAILQNKVGSNYSAGVDFIGDKEFYVYVEDFIHFYLHEQPILRNIPTQKFIDDRTGQLKSDLIRQVSKSKDEFVVKKVDGRGGDSVWVGSKTDQAIFDAILGEVAKNPSVYIVQKYMHLSVHGNNIVDLRAISAVLPDQVIVAKTPWGRGLPESGNGKVNLSDQGREVTVLVARSQKPWATQVRCDTIFQSSF